jgi:cytochrome P450
VTDFPSYDVDLFTDEVIAEPYDHYRRIRDLGPVVRLDAHDLLAVGRYDDVRRVLGDPDTFCSGEGVGLNDVVNAKFKGNTLMSDGERHRVQREVVGRPLRPKALAALQPDVQELADVLVDQLVARGSFDASPKRSSQARICSRGASQLAFSRLPPMGRLRRSSVRRS